MSFFPFLQTLVMFLQIVSLAVGIPLFITGRISRRKPLWVAGLILLVFAVSMILAMIIMVAMK